MRQLLFFRLVWITIPFFSNTAKSQSDPFAYSITSVVKGGTQWIALRKLDLKTGEYGPVLLNMREIIHPESGTPATDGYSQSIPSGLANTTNATPGFGSSVAALAYDRKSNRLYFTPMQSDNLRYIDLGSLEMNSLSGLSFSKTGHYDSRNAGPVNRMVIAPDGYGYTITNDGTHLMRFTTNGSPSLMDLGDLQDDPKNKESTIHSICSNSGGDLVADDAGHLILITGYNRIYKVDIASRVCTWLGSITGLPEKFTTSGVAVSESGKQLIISSAVYTGSYFTVDPESWHASPLLTSAEIFESADLANSNTLFTNDSGSSGWFITKGPGNQNRIRVFPNPVLHEEVSIQFNELPAGRYTIQLTDAFGKQVKEQKVFLTEHSQTEIMPIPRSAVQGFYYIRILDEKNNAVGTQKLVLERW